MGTKQPHIIRMLSRSDLEIQPLTRTVSANGPTKTGLIVFSPLESLLEGLQVDFLALESNVDNKYSVEIRNFSNKTITLPRKFELDSAEFDFPEESELKG